jgi:hypothetical protein
MKKSAASLTRCEDCSEACGAIAVCRGCAAKRYALPEGAALDAAEKAALGAFFDKKTTLGDALRAGIIAAYRFKA